MEEKENKVGQATPTSWKLTEDQQLNYQALYILYLITENKVQFPNFLTGKLKFVQKAIDFLEEKGLIAQKEEFDEKKVLGFKIGQTDIKWVFEASKEAKTLVKKYRKQFREFIRLHDVYAHVDPHSGEFALNKFKKLMLKKKGEKEWNKYKNNERWVDYRVPVAVYKGIDPREFVFFSFMEEGRFIPNADDIEHQWAEDLFMETIWTELYEVLDSAPIWEEQGSEDDTAQEIMETIIIEGANTLHSQRKKLKKYIAEQDSIIGLSEEMEQIQGEHDSDEDHYFEDPVYYHGMYHYTPLTDPFFWVTAAIIL